MVTGMLQDMGQLLGGGVYHFGEELDHGAQCIAKSLHFMAHSFEFVTLHKANNSRKTKPVGTFWSETPVRQMVTYTATMIPLLMDKIGRRWSL